jgi:hypothetical protein
VALAAAGPVVCWSRQTFTFRLVLTMLLLVQAHQAKAQRQDSASPALRRVSVLRSHPVAVLAAVVPIVPVMLPAVMEVPAVAAVARLPVRTVSAARVWRCWVMTAAMGSGLLLLHKEAAAAGAALVLLGLTLFLEHPVTVEMV